MTKVCYRCKEERPVSDFSKDRTRKDGLSNKCADCDRELYREYYRRNREEVRERKRKHQKENIDYYVSKSRENQRKKRKISASMATKSGRWSQEEVDLLVELRKTRTVYQCAIKLGRRHESTQAKIRSLRKKGVEI